MTSQQLDMLINRLLYALGSEILNQVNPDTLPPSARRVIRSMTDTQKQQMVLVLLKQLTARTTDASPTAADVIQNARQYIYDQL